jgi:hypothetical protein
MASAMQVAIRRGANVVDIWFSGDFMVAASRTCRDRI